MFTLFDKAFRGAVQALGFATAPESTAEEDTEEGLENYHVGGFHPVVIGETYASKYRVLRKLGYGQYSTVWLVRDLQTRKFWAMKVLSAECYGDQDGIDIFELEILQHLKNDASEHPGSKFITMLEDHFVHVGPNGQHHCIIFQIMGESLASFRQKFPGMSIPSPLVQLFTKQLLQALDFAHARGVIHTDIQPGNIMLRNPDETHLLTYLEKKYPDSSPEAELKPQHSITRSEPLKHHYFGWPFNLSTLEVNLGDWGVASWTDKHLTETIQPVLLRAPEVILEAPWDQAVDIWNLGALMPELIYGQLMFSGGPRSSYSLETHLAEINGLLGPFPPRLISESRLQVTRELFDTNGNLRKPKLKRVISLAERFEDLADGEGQKLEEFVRSLMAIDSRARPTASEALGASWITHEYSKPVAVEPVKS